MRFEQQMSWSVKAWAAFALTLCLSASGQAVFAFEQAAQPPGSPAPQVPAAAAPAGPTLPITADEAVRLALQHNLGLEAERLGPEVSAFAVAQARAAYAPNLFSTLTRSSGAAPPDNFLVGTGNVITDSGTRSNSGVRQFVPWGGGQYSVSFNASRSTTTAFSSFNPRLRSNLDMTYTQPLLRNFKIDGLRQQLLLSRNQAQIADLDLRQRIAQTSRSVRSAYYDLVGAIAGMEVAHESLNLARESLKNNQRRVEVGTMAPIDIVEAEAEVASNEEAVILAEAQIRRTEDALRTLVMNPSHPDFWTTRLEPAEQPTLTPKQIDVDAAIANAMANRTDLAAFRKRIEGTDINLEYTKNQKLPAVDLQANYGVVGLAGTQFDFGQGFPPPILGQKQRSFGDALRDVFGNEFRSWSFVVNVGYPIGTSQASAALAAGRLQRQQQQTSLRELETQVAFSVREAGRQVSTSLQRVQSTTKARELAQQRMQAEEKRLAVGLSDTFRVFQAQRDLTRARRAELQAIIDYNRALVDFEVVQLVPIGR
jgi:outer membrane protein TolC